MSLILNGIFFYYAIMPLVASNSINSYGRSHIVITTVNHGNLNVKYKLINPKEFWTEGTDIFKSLRNKDEWVFFE